MIIIISKINFLFLNNYYIFLILNLKIILQINPYKKSKLIFNNSQKKIKYIQINNIYNLIFIIKYIIIKLFLLNREIKIFQTFFGYLSVKA